MCVTRRDMRKKFVEGAKGSYLILIFKFCGETTSVRKRGLAIKKAKKMEFIKNERESVCVWKRDRMKRREWLRITDSRTHKF